MHSLLIRRPFIMPDYIVHSEDTRLLEQLQILHTPFSYNPGPLSRYIYDRADSLSIRLTQHGYALYHNNIACSQGDPLQQADEIISRQVTTCPPYYGVHAAAVGYDGKAYIFAGQTGAGKTTLSVFLTAKGMDYITDDGVFIRRDDQKVHPFRKAVFLRRGGLDILDQYGICPQTVVVRTPGEDRYMYLPGGACSHSYNIGGFYMLQRTDDTNTVERMNAADSMDMLLKQALYFEKPTAALLIFLSKIAACGCHRLQFCDMQFVYQVILEAGGSHKL